MLEAQGACASRRAGSASCGLAFPVAHGEGECQEARLDPEAPGVMCITFVVMPLASAPRAPGSASCRLAFPPAHAQGECQEARPDPEGPGVMCITLDDWPSCPPDWSPRGLRGLRGCIYGSPSSAKSHFLRPVHPEAAVPPLASFSPDLQPEIRSKHDAEIDMD